MFPTFFQTDVVSLHSWGLMVMLAFVAAAGVTHIRAAKVGVDPDSLVPMYLIIAVFGMLGARVLHFVFADLDTILADPMVFFSATRGGWAFYGGAIGGTVSAALYTWSRGLPTWKLADAAAPTIMLGYAVGRIGCFTAGCCHGGVLDQPVTGELLGLPAGEVLLVEGFPWLGLRFEPGVGVGALRGEVLFPSQLLEIATGIVVFGLLSAMWRLMRRFDGQVLAGLLVVYAAARSFTESFRGDTVRGLHDLGPVQLSTSQIVSVGMLVVAVAIVALRWPKGLAPEQPFSPPEPEL